VAIDWHSPCEFVGAGPDGVPSGVGRGLHPQGPGLDPCL